MADEVIISERRAPSLLRNGQVIMTQGERLGTQVLDTAQLSAAFGDNTQYIRITANGASIWYKIGASDVSAAANTDGNEFLANGTYIEEPVKPGQFIDTAADV